MVNTKFVFIVLFCSSINLFSQVGINTISPNAQLDVRSSNQATPSNKDGILIPKINIFPSVNPTVDQHGMMVYLTTTSGLNQPGFYFWDNTSISWKSVGGATPAWNLTGNSSTDPVTMFIGTTDDKDVVFKRGNVFSGIIGSNSNTSFGTHSYKGNNGTNNTAFGFASLNRNTTGDFNVALGVNSMTSNTIGRFNIAIGHSSLYGNINGGSNISLGYASMLNNISGSNNVTIGNVSLYNNISGGYNVSVGDGSLYSNTSGQSNVSLGSSSTRRNTIGSSNTAVGSSSLFSNIDGNSNVAVGESSLYQNDSGSYNVSLGTQSLYSNTSGFNNTAIGNKAFYSGSNYSNSTAIGYNSTVSGNNQVRIGDTNITYAGTQVAWSITSDKRWKNEIKKSNLGLDFIANLNPVFYKRNNDKTNKTEYGFIAQELEQSLIKFGAMENGIISKDNDGMLSIRYNDLLAPMVKSIQDLKVENNMLKNQNLDLEKRLKIIEERLK